MFTLLDGKAVCLTWLGGRVFDCAPPAVCKELRAAVELAPITVRADDWIADAVRHAHVESQRIARREALRTRRTRDSLQGRSQNVINKHIMQGRTWEIIYMGACMYNRQTHARFIPL